MDASLVLWSSAHTDRSGDSDVKDSSDDSDDGANVEDGASKTGTSVKNGANEIKSRTDASWPGRRAASAILIVRAADFGTHVSRPCDRPTPGRHITELNAAETSLKKLDDTYISDSVARSKRARLDWKRMRYLVRKCYHPAVPGTCGLTAGLRCLVGRVCGPQADKSTKRTGVIYLRFAASSVAGSALVECSGHSGIFGPAWADKAVQDELDKQAAAAGNASTRVALQTAQEALNAKKLDLRMLAAASVRIARAIAAILAEMPDITEGAGASSDSISVWRVDEPGRVRAPLCGPTEHGLTGGPTEDGREDSGLIAVSLPVLVDPHPWGL